MDKPLINKEIYKEGDVCTEILIPLRKNTYKVKCMKKSRTESERNKKCIEKKMNFCKVLMGVEYVLTQNSLISSQPKNNEKSIPYEMHNYLSFDLHKIKINKLIDELFSNEEDLKNILKEELIMILEEELISFDYGRNFFRDIMEIFSIKFSEILDSLSLVKNLEIVEEFKSDPIDENSNGFSFFTQNRGILFTLISKEKKIIFSEKFFSVYHSYLYKNSFSSLIQPILGKNLSI